MIYKSKIALNGQVVVPKELRQKLRLSKGDTVMFRVIDAGNGSPLTVEFEKEGASISDLLGILKAKGK